MTEDGSGWGRGWDCGNFCVYLRGWEFLARDIFICDEVFKERVLKGKLGGPRFLFKLVMADGLGG